MIKAMFTRTPRSALTLALVGLIPFIAGAVMMQTTPDTVPLFDWMPSNRDTGLLILERYGVIILCFMSGTLWGFASRHGRKPSFLELGLSVIPPLVIFFGLSPNPQTSCLLLTYAFAGLLLIECYFAKRTIVVYWWIELRTPLTVIVCACLLTGAFG